MGSSRKEALFVASPSRLEGACKLAQTEKHIVYSARSIRRGLVYLWVVGMLQGGKCIPVGLPHVRKSERASLILGRTRLLQFAQNACTSAL